MNSIHACNERETYFELLPAGIAGKERVAIAADLLYTNGGKIF